MKTKLFCSVLLCGLIVGCSSFPLKKSYVVPSPGVTNVQYDIAPGLSNALSVARQINESYTPTPWRGIAETVLGGLVGILGLVAKYKTDRANEHKNAADTMAGTIVNAGLSVKALQNAADSKTQAVIAQHLDNNTNS